MKITVTYERLLEYDRAASAYLTRMGEKLGEGKTRIGYAIYRMSTRLQTIFRQYQDQIEQKTEDLMIDHCEVDEKKRIVRDERGGYVFSQESQKRLATALRKLQADMQKETVEVEQYIATSADLSSLWASEIDAFAGIILPADVTSVEPGEKTTAASA